MASDPEAAGQDITQVVSTLSGMLLRSSVIYMSSVVPRCTLSEFLGVMRVRAIPNLSDQSPAVNVWYSWKNVCENTGSRMCITPQHLIRQVRHYLRRYHERACERSSPVHLHHSVAAEVAYARPSPFLPQCNS